MSQLTWTFHIRQVTMSHHGLTCCFLVCFHLYCLSVCMLPVCLYAASLSVCCLDVITWSHIQKQVFRHVSCPILDIWAIPCEITWKNLTVSETYFFKYYINIYTKLSCLEPFLVSFYLFLAQNGPNPVFDPFFTSNMKWVIKW